MCFEQFENNIPAMRVTDSEYRLILNIESLIYVSKEHTEWASLPIQSFRSFQKALKRFYFGLNEYCSLSKDTNSSPEK